MSKKKVLARCGAEIFVDTSDEACLKFGFKSGAEIIDGNCERGVIEGVGSCVNNICPFAGGCTSEKIMVLWYALDKDNGKVSFWEYRNNNLRNVGFKEV